MDSRLTPEEYRTIHNKAKATGYTSSEYMRRVACGYPLQSMVDQLAVNELIQMRADLGRLGGLFKKWLTENEKTRVALGSRSYQEINSIVSNISEDEKKLLIIAERIIKAKRRI
ncbi:MAG: hypothetical protein P794_09455 [Epsilonproteobacteria bacterium (ex Lamellibrachia satsuma)]|nr:MAG: hypothetical protein P794_09455 [Epsilonproteobacteria bacterium (ex Lamellibrachia satsuma)]